MGKNVVGERGGGGGGGTMDETITSSLPTAIYALPDGDYGC